MLTSLRGTRNVPSGRGLGWGWRHRPCAAELFLPSKKTLVRDISCVSQLCTGQVTALGRSPHRAGHTQLTVRKAKHQRPQGLVHLDSDSVRSNNPHLVRFVFNSSSHSVAFCHFWVCSLVVRRSRTLQSVFSSTPSSRLAPHLVIILGTTFHTLNFTSP